jgi:putative ABC transport system ATP-binding protein
VLEALDKVNRELGTTTLIITHNVVQAEMAQRTIYLRDGQVTSIELNEHRRHPRELTW